MDRAHVFHSWSAQGALNPLPIAAAEGSYFWDYDGKRYLDFSCQLVNTNIGHQHPKVIAAIAAQAAEAVHHRARSTPTTTRGEAPPGCAARPPTAWRRSSSPTAAPTPTRTRSGWPGCTPAGTRCCRYYRSLPRRHRQRDHRHRRPAALAQRVRHRPRALLRARSCTGRRSGPTTQEQESERALEHLEQVIQFEGPATIAAIILETILGTAGMMIPPPGYLAGVRALCDKHGIVYIADEVMCGLRPDRPAGSRSSTTTSCPT